MSLPVAPEYTMKSEDNDSGLESSKSMEEFGQSYQIVFNDDISDTRPVMEMIFTYLDHESLAMAEGVCKKWYNIISQGMLWKKLIEHNVRTKLIWRRLAEKRGWVQYLFEQRPGVNHLNHAFYRNLLLKMNRDIENSDKNWRNGIYKLQRIRDCHGYDNDKGVFCLQYDDQKIVSGLRDHTIKIYDRKTLRCTKVLKGHTGSVGCLQYNDEVIISGASDKTVRVWDVDSGDMVNTLIHHSNDVLHLRFKNGILVTSSKDYTIAVWDMTYQPEFQLLYVLSGHQEAVNAVDLDEKYIVSGGSDRKIKVWNTSTGELVRTLNGHTRGVSCLQYRYPLIVSGSNDTTISLWDIESGVCLRTLGGYREHIICLSFNDKYIVSSYTSGKIRIMDLMGAFDPQRKASTLCLRTFRPEHTEKLFAFQFDEFHIVSCSRDDSILIWDFLDQSADTIANADANAAKQVRA